MGLLSQAVADQRLEGFQMEPGKELVYPMFADDVGVFLKPKQEVFDELMRILQRYECASGAQINLRKSLIMPLGRGPLLEWIQGINCEVITPENSFRYLGIRVGRASDAGSSPVGKPKKALIAWAKVCRPKSGGELGLISFEVRARALMMWHIFALLENRESDWICMILRMIRIKLITGVQKVERSQWESRDALLLLDSLRIPEAPTVDRLLQQWFVVKKKLRLSPTHSGIRGSLPVASLRYIGKLMGLSHDQEFTRLNKVSRNLHISMIGECQRLCTVVSREWWRLRLGCTEEERQADESFLSWVADIQVAETSLAEMIGWEWNGGWEVRGGWTKEATAWSNLLMKPQDNFQCHSWEVLDTDEVWKERWRLLWQEGSLVKHKTWIWKTLLRGFPTLDRLAKWGMSNGRCMLCQQEGETLEHLMWNCGNLRSRVYWISEVILGPEIGNHSMLQVLDKCLHEHKGNPVLFMLFYEHVERGGNAVVFNNVYQFKDASQIAITVGEICTGMGRRLPEERKAALYSVRDIVLA
ncbi:hypothetical protein R1sor_018250 [Riccia sorocarpa]|uniref:Reverse transcriptase zinc-binding domain-containing protein n=1 Tax=Riccia sorocarpa TaxID=122646 RepID=A0ABD3I957_9MARC